MFIALMLTRLEQICLYFIIFLFSQVYACKYDYGIVKMIMLAVMVMDYVTLWL